MLSDPCFFPSTFQEAATIPTAGTSGEILPLLLNLSTGKAVLPHLPGTAYKGSQKPATAMRT